MNYFAPVVAVAADPAQAAYWLGPVCFVELHLVSAHSHSPCGIAVASAGQDVAAEPPEDSARPAELPERYSGLAA